MKSHFADRAKITVKAGDGGSGCVSFRREKFIPKGGPDGGNGGDGGSVILEASPHLVTLYDFKLRPYYKAANGMGGEGNRKQGKDGDTLLIRVPCGTEVYRDGDIIADLVFEGDSVCAARGGKGGRGNDFFKSSVNQTPRRFEKGTPGEGWDLLLKLKLIADVGLVGFPNAGKSTLLGRISNARPRVAAYPFTTLKPNLGVLETPTGKISFADLPGIVEGAHAGKGLGFEFLAHLERVKVLLFVLDVQGFSSPGDPYADFKILLDEIKQYNPFLLEKPFVIALNKIDTCGAELAYSDFSGKHFGISALEGTGVKGLVEHIREVLC
ncbi:MAG: GTPase ObgE [Elusimicrobia bacterium CG_4_8_14_3_um_filter_50_9]|nr:MAG: GTPase ObgE [Elusimicrobia bacterium CG_4_8_14_3_um_filter_50_9]